MYEKVNYYYNIVCIVIHRFKKLNKLGMKVLIFIMKKRYMLQFFERIERFRKKFTYLICFF